MIEQPTIPIGAIVMRNGVYAVAVDVAGPDGQPCITISANERFIRRPGGGWEPCPDAPPLNTQQVEDLKRCWSGRAMGSTAKEVFNELFDRNDAKRGGHCADDCAREQRQAKKDRRRAERVGLRPAPQDSDADC